MVAENVLQQSQFRPKIRAGGRPGRTDPRGNAANRRRQKEKLLTDPNFKHNEDHPVPNVHCVHCGNMLTYDTLERDRVQPGGPYAYHNLQPACRACNLRRSNNTTWKGPLALEGKI
jgi:hypothetical protein